MSSPKGMVAGTVAIVAAFSVLAGCVRAPDAAADDLQFVYLRLPGEIQPVDRHAAFESPIDAQLKARGIGEVTGGGTLQSAPDARGDRRILHAGIDIEVADLDAARTLLRDILPGLGVPMETAIEFSSPDGERQDRLTETGWVLDEPHTEPTSGLR